MRTLGCAPYAPTLEAMRSFNARRDAATPDELWILEHPPVYTLGLAADAAHGPRSGSAIPVVQVERGGEITYHGPGQVVLYTLVDLARRGIKVREFVRLLERSVIELLDGRGEVRAGAPGVYVDGAKVAALGIRVSRGCSFHGLALNVDMDLAPFAAIDPCGYPGLRVTQTNDIGITGDTDALGAKLAAIVARELDHA
ncbi:MAG: lipoyl(octanoyl) transferase LipB [Proteobacteria bacterium]|nr:lipoyl(octanoyl) transferase LipB [Pseudomonadota bacterium]MDA0981920.1 lipoyl(octanoyl) transferase LipB [Pseudomonadota bacterium]